MVDAGKPSFIGENRTRRPSR